MVASMPVPEFIPGTKIRVIHFTDHANVRGGFTASRVLIGEDGNRYEPNGTFINTLKDYYGYLPSWFGEKINTKKP